MKFIKLTESKIKYTNYTENISEADYKQLVLRAERILSMREIENGTLIKYDMPNRITVQTTLGYTEFIVSETIPKIMKLIEETNG